MPQATFASSTVIGDKVYKAGETVEVSNEQFEELKKRPGLLHTKKGPTEQVLLNRQVQRQVAAQSGVSGGESDDDDFPTPPPEKEFVFLPVTAEQYRALSAAGYTSPASLEGATAEELTAVEGIDKASADRIIATVSGRTQAEWPDEEPDEGPDKTPGEQPTRSTAAQRVARLAGQRR